MATNGEELSRFSQELADAVERVGRSTVAIHARRRIPTTGVLWRDGVIATTHHTVERDEDVTVSLPDGSRVEAELLGRDPGTDLAVLRVAAGAHRAAEHGDAATLRPGHLVLAIGRAWEHGPTASLGVVSAVAGEWRTRHGSRLDRLLRLDLRIHDGFSGGPLTDGSGRVYGINSSALARGAALTIPASTVDRVVDDLLSHGRVRRGYLGIGMQPVRLGPELRAAFPWSGETGLMLVSVAPGSPAAEAGLLLGDVLVGVDDAPVRDPAELASFLGAERIGTTMRLHLLRAGAPTVVTVTVRERTPGEEG
jgi:S1-C subfamily serine protease